MKKLACLLTAIIICSLPTEACTNFLITKGASRDGSCMITYNADSPTLFGELYFWPAKNWAQESWLNITDWDSGEALGRIPQVSHTFNVIGNMNQYQLSIAETTFGGRSELQSQTGAIMDYGSLIYITLQRAQNAREAIVVISQLVDEFGYASSGESLSICDPNEVWIMEIIGKGEGEMGAVWVARKIPDGYVSAHANQARITTFPLDETTSIPSNKLDKIYKTAITTVYSKDVISFAKQKGYYPIEAKNTDFSFSDTYAPVDFGACRACEIRVWSFFNAVSEGMSKYWEYAKGTGIEFGEYGYATNRMPLWIQPERKLDVTDVMDLMRDHLEGTELDMTKDVGAGPFECPYRWRPLSYTIDSIEYINERATATQQTGFTFVAQSRSWLPDEIGGILWFGVDDAASSVYFPMYTSSTKIPEAYSGGNINEFDDTKAFWIFSQMSNFAYTRYNVIHPEIRKAQREKEIDYKQKVAFTDANARILYEQNKEKCIAYLTEFSCSTGDLLARDWKKLYGQLFAKYMDGLTHTVVKDKPFPDIQYNPAPEKFYRMIVDEMKDKQRVKEY